MIKELVDLLSDEDTVLKGYIAIAKANLTGHWYIGPDATRSVSLNREAASLDEGELQWCLVEKERGKAPLIFPVVEKKDLEDD